MTLLKEDVPNWSKGPHAQALIGGKARLEIEMMLLEEILGGKTQFSSLETEYWIDVHDRAFKIMGTLRAAAKDFPNDSGWLHQAQALLAQKEVPA